MNRKLIVIGKVLPFLFLAFLFQGCTQTECPDPKPTEPTEASCRELYENKLHTFEKENDYEVSKAEFILEESNAYLAAVRVSRDPETYKEFPDEKGQVVGTVYLQPRSKEAREEVKEGVYQMVMVPEKDSKEFVQIGLRPKANAMAAALYPIGLVPIIAPQHIGTPCVGGRRCPILDKRVRLMYQTRANNECKIFHIDYMCQLYVPLMGICFWYRNSETVAPEASANCTTVTSSGIIRLPKWF